MNRENGSHISQIAHSVSGGNSPVIAPEPLFIWNTQGGTIKTNETHDFPRLGDGYIAAVFGQELLTAQQEAELGTRAISGDISARNELVLRNQRFLLKIVGEFYARHPGLEYDDLFSEANIGLMRAAEKFDPSTGNRFVTYCRYWILQALTRFANQQSVAVRLPEHRAEELKKIRNAVMESGSMDPQALSISTGIETESVRMLLPYISGTISLDAKARTPDGDEGESLADLLLTVSVDYLECLRASELWDVLKQLPERQREVLMHRFGAFGRKKMTLQELADSYGITRERVRQIESKALSMCRSLGKHIA